MIARALKAVGRAYVHHLLVFTIGAVAGASEAFVVLTAIYHAGVCR